MIAAVYARKSTEQNGVSEEGKSVHRQIEHAKAFAQKKGWTVDPSHIYADDGISGAEFVKRPGFIRLMTALKPRPSFHILIMSEESRLGRESIETSYALKQIMDANVRVFFYLEDRERTLDNAMDKVMLSLTNFASEMERERARQRTHDALARKAQTGYVTGGKVYGYDNIDVFAPDQGPDGKPRRLYVRRQINPHQAKVIKRIFDLYAAGKGIQRIAKTLNADGVIPPRVARGWAPSAIRAMLYRPLYKGEIVWNQRQNLVKGGTKKRGWRPESEWITLQAPDLRIIPPDLWNTVHRRLALASQTYLRRNQTGTLLGRPATRDFDSPYLLSGLAQCKECGGSLVALRRAKGGKTIPIYGCLYHHKRGPTVCTNSTVIRQDLLNQVVLNAISEVLDERLLEQAVDTALAHLRTGQETRLDRRTAIERELSLIEAKERRLVEAIARGEAVEPLTAGLKIEEERKKLLLNELSDLPQATKVVPLDEARLKREAKTRVKDVQQLLHRHIPQARQILRKLLVGRLECEAIETTEGKGYRITGEGSYGRFLPPTLSSTMVVPPA